MKALTTAISEDAAKVEQLAGIREEIIGEISKVIIGQKGVVELLLNSLLSQGHSLFVGVPGLAKTLLVSTLSRVLKLRFNRVQFTPDLMPSDIIGSEVLDRDPDSGKRLFRFIHGPIFCNLLLADEINRSSPKTQAALLQAMQELKVTVGGETHTLSPPFHVMATQNPIEQEGTYPLPEAELDRFMFQIDVDYPSMEEEVEIVKTTTSSFEPDLKVVLDARQIMDYQGLVRRVPVPDHVAEFAVTVARSTRPHEDIAPEVVKKWVSWGVGPRASQFLLLGSKARAILDGRYAPGVDDVRALAPAVLKHRIVINFRGEAEGIKADRIITEILNRLR
ncbi:MAG: MoxR family ATPase [Candidatus Dadabacteria bacterium]|nr:MoxR family ATPase [Candidatus Dadabacteria bacterium]